MTSFTKADLAAFRLVCDGAFNDRIAAERRNYDTMTSDEQKICDDLCHSLRLYYAHVSDDASLGAMLKSSVDGNFINTRNIAGKYVAKKVYELAEYIANVTGKLDTYDMLVFTTLYNFTVAGKAASRDHLKASIDHSRCSDDDSLVHRLASFRKGTGTSSPQHGSSLASFKVYGIAKAVTCKDTGKEKFVLDMNAYATKAMIARLALAK